LRAVANHPEEHLQHFVLFWLVLLPLLAVGQPHLPLRVGLGRLGRSPLQEIRRRQRKKTTLFTLIKGHFQASARVRTLKTMARVVESGSRAFRLALRKRDDHLKRAESRGSHQSEDEEARQLAKAS